MYAIIGGNSHFASLGWILAKLETANNVHFYAIGHMLSQHPHSHPLEWVPQDHQGCQNRRHSNNGSKVHKVRESSSHSSYKPHGVRTRKHFLGPKSTMTKRFMLSDTKKGGVIFDIFAPPPSPPTPPLSLSQISGCQVGGVWGLSDQKLIGGMCSLDKILIVLGVEPTTFSPLG